VRNAQRQALIDQREELAQQNRLRDRVKGFAHRVQATIDRPLISRPWPSVTQVVGKALAEFLAPPPRLIGDDNTTRHLAASG
jgi:hypothetical protein